MTKGQGPRAGGQGPRGDGRRALLALSFALLVLLPLFPTLVLAQEAAPMSIERLGDDVVALDTAHLSARIRFRVTSTASAADYVTIPRGDIRWSDGSTALGFPSPEFGLPLRPGESGEMWVHADVGEPRVGARELRVPFRSELTGATTTVTVPVDVRAAPEPSATLVVRAPLTATLTVTDLTSVLPSPGLPPPDPSGARVLRLAPGRYAIRADAAGFDGATRFIDVNASDRFEVGLALAPAKHEVISRRVTVGTVDDSVWTLAGSADLQVLATAPMVHKEPGEGRFVVLSPTAIRNVTFPPVEREREGAGPFQALDTTVAVSADGALVAGFDWNGRVRVHDVATGRELWADERAGERNPLYPGGSAFGNGFLTSGAVAFTPEGDALAAGGSNGKLVVFDAANGSARWSRDFGAEIRALRYAADGARLFVGSGDWALHALDAATGEEAWSAPTEFWPFFFLSLDANGTRIAEGGKDSVLRVFEAQTGAPTLSVDVFPAFVTGAGFAADGGVVFSDWGYGVRKVSATGAPLWFRPLKAANVAVTPDGLFAVVAWSDNARGAGDVEVLDTQSGSTVWSAAADLTQCSTDVSPFPAKQLKSVLVAQHAPMRYRFAAACIGGGVFVGDVGLGVKAAPPQPPPAMTTRATTPAAATPGATLATPPATTPTGPTSDTPLGVAWALAAVAAGALLLRRRR